MVLRYDRRLLLLALAGALPGLLATLVLMWRSGYSLLAMLAAGGVIVLCWGLAASALRRHVVFPLRTLANLIEAIRGNDFSFRASGAKKGDPLGEALLEINALADARRDERRGALEAMALLRGLMSEIDVVVLAFDDGRRLRLVNRAGERLLGQPAEQLIARAADEIGLAESIDGPAEQILTRVFPGGSGRWQVRRGAFRQRGLPHRLVIMSDMSAPLRQQEQEAWQKLVRVLGHELNNSLAPIKSIAGSLEKLAEQDPLPADWRDDMRKGLGVIASRSDALSRFTGRYTELARLPRPNKMNVNLAALLQRVATLETRKTIAVADGKAVELSADPDQLEQMMINLVGNATDAALETGGAVSISWEVDGRVVSVFVDDEGPGLASTANLFVPFFTTKPHGSGIGLVVSRQIAEGHGGWLTLEPRGVQRGARATVTLPLR